MPPQATPTEQTKPEAGTKPVKPSMDPVRKWTFITLALIVLLLAWYLVSDRFTPFTSQARVHALVVPIAPEVSGTVISVAVGNNQKVKAGQELFRIEPDRYELAVQTAEASLQSARQSMGASSANVEAAKASVLAAQASLVRADKDTNRLTRIMQEDPGAVSMRRLEMSEASLATAHAQLGAAKANLEKALQDLGLTGEKNALVLQAQTALNQATLNLERTIINAAEDGLVTDMRVNKGSFAAAGAPLMTFLAIDNVWLQADFTENNLGHIRPGNAVQIVFDVFPGEIFAGKVRESGFGVAVDTAPLGSLPTIDNNRDWLRAAQRYPVLIDFDSPGQLNAAHVRVGSQATVVVYTGDNALVNTLAHLQIWLDSILTYAY